MDAPIRVGLAGFGMVSQVFHAPLLTSPELAPLFALTHVLERSSDTARERYGVQRCTALAELLAAPVELVVVCTPTASHFDVAQQCLLAGKHVVCEKPFTVTGAEARELAALAAERGLVLSVFQNRRWDGDFRTLAALLAAGTLGELAEFEARYDRFRPELKPGQVWRERPEPGSGVLYDLGSHLLDQAVQLFGRPAQVRGDVRAQRSSDAADDYFDVDLRYERPGLKVTLKAGCIVRSVGPHYVAHGTKGSFVKHGLDVQEAQLKEGVLPGQPGYGVEPEAQWGRVDLGSGPEVLPTQPGCYEEFYAQLARAVRHGAPAPVSAADAALVVELIERAHESSRAGGRLLDV